MSRRFAGRRCYIGNSTVVEQTWHTVGGKRGAELGLHEDAGRLLRHWHDHSDAGSAVHRAAVHKAMGAYAREAAEYREALAGRVPDDVLALVSAAATKIRDLADRLPLLFLHGDHAIRNWLVDTATGRHALIDFEQSRYGLVVEEYVWLLGVL